MTPDRLQPYKMSFSTGGLFLNESIVVAGLHVPGNRLNCAFAISKNVKHGSCAQGAGLRPELTEIQRFDISIRVLRLVR